MTDPLVEAVFKLGEVYFKLEHSKRESAGALKMLGGGESEQIVLQKIGKFWNQENMWDRPDGLVVVTTHRFVFLSKLKSVTVTTDFMSVPYAEMTNLRAARVMGISPAVQFTAGGKTLTFTLLSGAEEVVAAMQGARAAA
jgi:hypothetical protein